MSPSGASKARGLAALAFVLSLFGAGCGSCASSTGTTDGGVSVDGAAREDGGEAGTSQRDGGAEDAGFDESALARPTESTEALAKRMQHVVEAIAQDNPELAKDLLVPRQAFGLLFESKDPTGAWDRKVKPAFDRGIQRSHKTIKNPGALKFVSFELGSVESVSPRKKGWKYAIYRASKSTLTVASGERTKRISVPEMIGYRGSWYIVRLRSK